jgi:uncharacterized protein (DUF2062 family)
VSAAPKRTAPLATTIRGVWRHLRGGELTASRAAASVALGVFVGCLPLYGFQFWLCLAIALPLRLDYPLSLLSTLIANPLTMPLLLAIEVEIGAFVVTGRFLPFSLSSMKENGIGSMLGYATLGSLLLGTVLAGLAAGLVGIWVKTRARKPLGGPSRVPSVRPSAG